MEELNVLNPQIVEIVIGIRKLRKIKIYPLSMADQLQLTSLVVVALQKLFNQREENNFIFAELIKDMVTNNLGKIMSYITDEGEEILKDISNSQAMDIAECIFDMNYGVLEKKTKGFLEKIKKVFLLPKLPPTSSEDTPSIDLNISTEEVIETEE